VHESPPAMTFPLICLAVLSAIGGLVGIPEVFMKNGNKLGDFLSPVFAESNKILVTNPVAGQTEITLMAASSLLIIMICIWAWNKFAKFDGVVKEQGAFAKAIENKFYVDEIYDAIIVKPLKALSVFLSNVVERSGIDALVNGVGKGVSYTGRQIRLLQSGFVGNYLLLMVVGLILFLIIQLFSK